MAQKHNTIQLSGWGRYPRTESKPSQLNQQAWQHPLIATGNHRSYGDAALAPIHLPMRKQNRLINFDQQAGLLTCEAGVLLSEIIEVFLPRGWFLAITPGTKLITVGGAVASDVHGKNHHLQGCFSESVESIELMLPNNQTKTCSRTKNPDLFHATCGGMGLTGIITQVSFYLKPVQSQWINQTTIKTANLKQTFEAFEQYQHSPYAVAWIDCLATGDNLGRSLLMVGDFAQDGDLSYQPKNNLTIPFDFPTLALNRFSVKAFNALYYRKAKKGESQQRVGIDSFFYPLDAINHWNRIYGKHGFVQFQFILPKAVSFDGLQTILKRISESGMGSFLAVLKLYGAQNQNWLSFPMEGYSLALDFKMQPGLVPFIRQLTDQLVEQGGRVYLAKDALLTRQQFEQGYPKVEQFRALRKDMGLDAHFQSLLSQRLGL
ncbi:MAG: FAD-binding oxidoreductase [Thiomicrospira sp.]|jgi:FAD/FMN-containing dehydrogenase|nr:FAD-binding oxidoreductase [Thiomicrospira sp.]